MDTYTQGGPYLEAFHTLLSYYLNLFDKPGHIRKHFWDECACVKQLD